MNDKDYRAMLINENEKLDAQMENLIGNIFF